MPARLLQIFHMMLFLLVAAVGSYAVFAFVQLGRARPEPGMVKPVWLSIALHATLPFIVIIYVGGLYLIIGFSRTAQINAVSELATKALSVWFRLWPVFLFATFMSLLANGSWLFIASTTRHLRRWSLPALLGTLLSALTLYTLLLFFPTA